MQAPSQTLGAGSCILGTLCSQTEPRQLTPAAIVPVFLVGIKAGEASEMSVDAAELGEKRPGGSKKSVAKQGKQHWRQPVPQPLRGRRFASQPRKDYDLCYEDGLKARI